MKVAILIDTIEVTGGGETIALALARRYNADVYTSKIDYEKVDEGFRKIRIRTLGRIPSLPLLKQEVLLQRFKNLDLSAYDRVIAMGGYSYYSAYSNDNVIWYAFGMSPLFHSKGKGHEKAWALGKAYYKPAVVVWKHRLKGFDKEVVMDKLKGFVTISGYTGSVLTKYYGRVPGVINPPVNTEECYNAKSKGYYLMVDRLVPEKRVHIAIEAFKRMKDRQLIIKGTGVLEEQLKKLAGGAKNIKFIPRVSLKELYDLYAHCTALITCASGEDWSMVMVDAMASGKPCIAVDSGAYGEVVNDGVTGMLVDAGPEALMKAVKKLDAKTAARMKAACIRFASHCSMDNFYRKWDEALKEDGSER